MPNEDCGTRALLSKPESSDYPPEANSQREGDRVVKGVQILAFKPESHAEKAGMQKGDVIIAYDGVGDLTTEKLTALVAERKEEGIGPRVSFFRNGGQHCVTLPPRPLGISGMDTTIQGSLDLMTVRDRTEGRVRTIQRVYLAFIVVASIAAPFVILGAVKSRVDGLMLSLSLLIDTSIYLGLRRRREWVIPLVVFVSALQCIWLFLNIMGPAGDIKALTLKMVALLGLLFFGYQISFFSRPKVRALFGDRDCLVF